MKKFLSLVLALVMTMSLVTVAGAKDFTDAADVDYTAAVNVMEATKVITGYTDGSFRPDTALNRGQAAKIICNLILGPTEAAALSTSGAPFSDVPANHTFAGYIAYCASEGIINGYTDGTFRPAQPLNGYAFMKMLLGVLGYDGAIEGYTGTNWSINVAKQALAIDLNDGIAGFSGAKTVTRQEACQMAFQALKADWVKYDEKGTNINIGGVIITSGASEADPQAPYYTKLFEDVLTATAGNWDEAGRPATEWKYDGKVVAVETVSAEAIYTAAVKEDDLAKAMGETVSYNYYFNGNYESGTLSAVKGNKTTYVAETGNGIIVEFYEDEDLAVVLHPDVVEVLWVDEDDDGRYVETEYGKFYTESFEEEDMVVVTLGDEGNNAYETEILSMAKTEKLTGKITKIADKKYTIGGTEYTLSASYLADIAGEEGDTVNFWLDTNGYVLEMKVASSAAKVEDLAFLIKSASAGLGYQAKMLFSDGTLKTVAVDTTDFEGFSSGTYDDNEIVEWDLEGTTYELDNVTNYYVAGDLYYFTKGTAKVYAEGDTDAVKVNDKTTFVVVDDDDYKGAKVYVGVKNAPSFKNATIAYTVNATTSVAELVFVFVDDAKVTSTTKDVIFFVGKASSTAPIKELKADGKTTRDAYYTVNAIVNGEWKTLDVNASWSGTGIQVANNYESVTVRAYKSLTYDSDNLVVSGVAADRITALSNVTVTALKDGIIVLNDTALTAADDVNVYVVASDLKSMTKVALENVKSDDNSGNNNNYYAWGQYTTNADGQLNNLMLVRK